MKKLLVVVDLQRDFVDGALGTPEAQAIVPRVCERIRDFDGDTVFTMDTHTDLYPLTQEGQKLPVPHCLRGTAGWELTPPVETLSVGKRRFLKPTFGSVELAEYVAAGEWQEVLLIGLCTDICVISNALLLKAFLPELRVQVDESCCAGVTPESHRRALEAMRSCQVEILA